MHHPQIEFDTLDPAISRRRVFVSPATAAELRAYYSQIETNIAVPHASLETCERMRTHHPDHQWAVRSQSSRELIGYYLMLMLTSTGLEALLHDRFDPVEPDTSHVARPDQAIAAIFKWGVFVPGYAAAAIPFIAQYLRSDPYGRLDLYANASTEKGLRLMTKLGFLPVGGQSNPLLYRYRRLINSDPSSLTDTTWKSRET